MRIPQSYIQKCKVVAHVFQFFLIFITGCITLAVLTKGGETGGATKFYFALCFLSGPAIIYLVMTPMWSRAQRFANAYAFLSLDALYTILWFAAFIAVAMYNAQGIREGAKAANNGDDSNGNCTTFKYGPEDKCSLSRVTVGMGAAVFIFFGITTGVSAYYMVQFRKDGTLPYESDKVNPHHASGETTKDNAWSAEMDHRNSDEDDRRTERGGGQEEDEYQLLHSTETDEGRHPGRPLSWGDNSNNGNGTNRYGDPQPPYASYGGSDALSPGGYDDYRKDAGATSSLGGAAPYRDGPPGPSGQGYSFSGGGDRDRY
ncbi:hypothetical protein B0J11DRAFT_337580 [Dendryphion nanum]|uniref:MARVEL domain-containing protein n=1 Tax=Dendryphion nanum TaxID=256645 RepID=A0A9P9IK65_9PLEO|nr:hypothetical protein B0J11DRAFT_337580 [Dendryphion nanum]